MTARIEIHRHGTWQPAAEIVFLGDEACRVEYLPEYVFGDHPEPIGLGLPVGFETRLDGDSYETDSYRRVPPVLYDLVPQGPGRQRLVAQLGLRDHDGLVMPFVLNGALNPIGRLRVDQAVDYYQAQVARKSRPVDARRGFDLDEMFRNDEGLLERLDVDEWLAAGTTGVQGVAPKLLLTQAYDGGWYADGALEDRHARTHWLVKLPRGSSEDDKLVLRNEAAYLRVAAACGLRTIDEHQHHGDKLFVRRFDRQVTPHGVLRLHQESLASLAGLRGFGRPIDHGMLLCALRTHVDDPFAETVEYLKRDVLNLALRNTDNHARNTAVQVLPDGRVQLTPVFDFAPMFRDPEMIARSVHWRDRSGRRLHDWTHILEALDVPEKEKLLLAGELHVFAQTVGRLPKIAADAGVDDVVIDACRMSIDNMAEALASLPVATGIE
ncbi:MAG: HipA domain-containing protein [Rudaea sp.]|uniref:type II toxin-antitoxin system HipA family toxin n=1 Tax=unclassified Rudaea TaxID=2627037 RepID=UPI0010F6FE08|nr:MULTISPECIES: HipA domain-containing protein [unclassified Rudaea]MBN8886823.1 HipA domain-containing protein [Rudaea sp.]